MTDNMKLWESVQKTDPNHTKKVDIGRKFTSIDAHYQIMQATAAFGPVGQGWGYVVQHSVVTAGEVVLAAADVTLWVGNRQDSYGPWRGMAELLNAKGRVDDDAAKKATTDGITKALSHLGFNADVFLGKFDDNKYLAKVKAEFAEKPEAVTEEQAATLRDMIAATAQTRPEFLRRASAPSPWMPSRLSKFGAGASKLLEAKQKQKAA